MIYLIAYIAPNERVCSETFEANTQEQAIKAFREVNKGICQLLAVTEMEYDGNYAQGDYGAVEIYNVLAKGQLEAAKKIKDKILYDLRCTPFSKNALYNEVVTTINRTINNYIKEISDNVRKV